MSLSAFQAKYTSEDNESFYRLLDKQNQKKADK
jgi:protein DGCR14